MLKVGGLRLPYLGSTPTSLIIVGKLPSTTMSVLVGLEPVLLPVQFKDKSLMPSIKNESGQAMIVTQDDIRTLKERDQHARQAIDDILRLSRSYLRFVRKLAKIQGLKSMVVGGYYAMHWPQYLTKQMGVAVVETKYKDEARIRGLREFQQGTEDLIP